MSSFEIFGLKPVIKEVLHDQIYFFVKYEERKNICGSTGPGGPDIKKHWTLVCFYLIYLCFRRARIWWLWRRASSCWTNQRASPSIWTNQATRPGKNILTKTKKPQSSIERVSQPSSVNNKKAEKTKSGEENPKKRITWTAGTFSSTFHCSS